jgi:hypothetical protein
MKKINLRKIRISLSCERCGAKNFPNKGALVGHQKQEKCSVASLTRTQVHRIQATALLQDVAASSSAIANEFQDSFESISLMNAKFEPVETNKPKPDFDSSFKLLQFIRICHNTKGLSKTDTNLLLSTLFHPSFQLEEVTLRIWLDVEKHESTKYNFEDVS